ncbi:DUF4158 domain-containing protein [Mesorhizobium sp. Cs1299R1N1]
MARRKLLKIQDRQELFGVPTGEDSLIRHYTLSPADRLEIAVWRRKHSQFGFVAQLCMLRYPGRTLMANESPPPAMLNYISEVDPESFSSYARREPTRLEHDRMPGRLKLARRKERLERRSLRHVVSTGAVADASTH